MNDETVRVVTSTLVYVATVPAILFPICYFFGSPWRTTTVGKMMMVKSSAIGLIFVLIVLGVAFDQDYWGRDVLRLVAYAYLAIALLAQLLTLLSIQRRSRRGDYDRADVSTRPAREDSTR